jgi:hypothetical protein
MSFFDEIKTNYVKPVAKPSTWRGRFKVIEDYADANPWDDVQKPDEKEIKKCIQTLFEAVNDACAGFRWIQEKENSTTAKSLADILEGR